jgi:hypothetical protein
MGAPGHSLLEPDQNYISISNLFSFGVFGVFKQWSPPPYTGGGGGCSSSLKTSIAATVCPGNSVVVLLTDSLGTPVGAGQLVTLTGARTTLIEHTNSSGEASFTLPSSGRYTVGGVACDYSFNYEVCRAGCTSDDACGDNQYCDASGACKPVGCPCGQISAHSCHPYACCADADCNASYTCVNHLCKSQVVQPECTSNDNCGDDHYCSNGKCLTVQIGECGYVANHAWHSYECCNDSGCQKGSVCVNNSCVLYRIVTDPSGFVGSQHEVWVLPVGQYHISIMTPKGENKTMDTDAAGHAVFALDSAGVYSVSLIKEQAAANVTVNAVSKPAQQQQTATAPPQQDLCLPGIIIGIILLLAIIYVIYRRR